MKLTLVCAICSFLFFNSFAVDTTKITYTNFSDLSKWQLNGNAKGSGSGTSRVLRLTNSTTSQSGSAFIKEPIQLVSDKGFKASFSAYFSFQIANTGGLDEGDGAGADGLVFVIQTVANNVGSLGGGLGYRGIPRSIGVEFDTWTNGDSANDPDDNHVGIDTNGSTRSIKTYSEKTLFNNGKIWFAWIDYDGDNQLLEVRYDTVDNRPESPVLSQKVDIPKLLVQENVFVGFTSATGMSFNTHDILSFSFINKFQPYVYSLTLSAKPDVIVNASDSVTLIATVRDMSNVLQPDSAKKTEWRIINAGGNPSTVLKALSGSEVLLVPEKGNSQIIIEGSVLVNNRILVDTITIQVRQSDAFTLKITAEPDTVVKAYDTVTLRATIYNHSEKIDSDSLQKTVWKLLSTGSNPESVLKSKTGAQVELVPTSSSSVIKLEASVTINNQRLSDTISIRTSDAEPYRITIETVPVNVKEPSQLDKLTLAEYPQAESVYAVVRDRWGGFIRMGDSLKTVWRVISGSDIITVTGTDLKKYIGNVTRNGLNGEAMIEVSEGTLIKDSLPVTVSNLYIDKIVIRDRDNGKTLDSLSIRVGQSKTLDVYGLVAGIDPQNQNAWKLVKADWSISGFTATFENPLPQNSESWNCIAKSSGQGKLSVTSGKNQTAIPFVILMDGKITIDVSSNPFQLGGKIPAEIITYYKNVLEGHITDGVIVAIHSTIQLKKDGGSFGHATIYDAVGNIVCSNLQIKSANDNTDTEYGIYWDGKNRNSRYVGQGTYLLKLTTTDIQDKEHAANVKIGVVKKD